MDDTRRKILERRAQFVFAALASLGSSACDKPQSCLAAVSNEVRDTSSMDPQDASTLDAASDAATADAAKPMSVPCLQPIPRRDAGPKVCLKPTIEPGEWD